MTFTLAILGLLLAGGAVALGGVLPDAGVISYDYSDDRTITGSDVRLLDTGRGLEVTLASGITVSGGTLAWSPDGQYLAFPLSLERAFIVLEPLTGWSRRFAPSNSAPTWAPDGTRIAYTSDEQSGLLFVDIDSDEPDNRIAEQDNTTFPAWSPDGQRIAFITYEQVDTLSRFNRTAMLLDVATGEIRELLPGHMHTTPIWSPDGRYLAVFPDLGQIHIIDAGSGETILDFAANNASYSSPVWSPDGESLIVIENRLGIASLVRYDIHTGDTTQLTGDGVNPSAPVWSPDGTQIALLSNHETNYDLIHYLYLIPTDQLSTPDTMQRLVNTSLLPQTSLAWQPR